MTYEALCFSCSWKREKLSIVARKYNGSRVKRGLLATSSTKVILTTSN